MSDIALIAAQSENRVIGCGPDLPWNLKDEQQLFKDITLGGVLVMGRKTFDSIGRPLPGRTTILVTRNAAYQPDGCLMASSVEAALAKAAQQCPGTGVYIAGGGEIYAQTMHLASTIHLTTVHITVEGDVFFPEVPKNEFTLVEEKKYSSSIDYTYRRYER